MISFKRTSQTLLFLTVGVVMANVAEAIKTEPVKAEPVKTEPPKKQDSERFEPIGIDRTPPVITTDAPLVASSNNVKFTTTMSDNVELAYISRSNTPVGQFVFINEGIKNDQVIDSASIGIGGTYSKMLMAVDTSGNVTKKTISITTPETVIKQGTYSTIGTYNLPAGFNCLMAYNGLAGPTAGAQDGAAVTVLTMGGSSPANPVSAWSVVDGYSPIMAISGVGRFSSVTRPQTLVPISATSLTFPYVQQGSGSSPWYSFEIGYTASATLSPTNPSLLDITVNMECNENRVGFVNGTIATFSVILNPPV